MSCRQRRLLEQVCDLGVHSTSADERGREGGAAVRQAQLPVPEHALQPPANLSLRGPTDLHCCCESICQCASQSSDQSDSHQTLSLELHKQDRPLKGFIGDSRIGLITLLRIDFATFTSSTVNLQNVRMKLNQVKVNWLRPIRMNFPSNRKH